MIRVLPNSESRRVFYPDVPQRAWACAAAAEIARQMGTSGGGRLFAVCMESFSDCEYFHSKLRAFFDFFGFGAALKILPPIPPSGDSKYFDMVCERVGTLNDICRLRDALGLPRPDFAPAGPNASGGLGGCRPRENFVLLCTPSALADKMRGEKIFGGFEVWRGMKTSIDALREKLASMGYYNEALCEAPGQFSVRGGIVDVYPAAADRPVRLDFFGDEIESIRTFNPDTQLGDGRAERVRVDAVPGDISGADGGGRPFCALDLMEGIASEWIFFEPRQVLLKNSELFSVCEGSQAAPSFAGIFGRRENSFCGISTLALGGELFDGAELSPFSAEDLPAPEGCFTGAEIGEARFAGEREERLKFAGHVASLAAGGMEVFVSTEGDSDESMVRELFAKIGFDASKFRFARGNFGDGFAVSNFGGAVSPKLSAGARGAVFVSAGRLIGRGTRPQLEPRRKMFSRRAQVDQALDFSELGEGDYVVHYSHGICRYHGVVGLDTNGAKQEFLKLEFEDGAYLYLPLHESHLLGRYIGLDRRVPKLSKLDGKSWTKVRTAAEHAALDYAAELLETQSKREISQGFAFPPDDDWQRAFDGAFAYVETPDQLRAIEEVKADMQKPSPMDRLLCADVGFGKTEVAMRAVFKAAMGGKQSAVLCPTTVLCQQHFRTFRERFAGFPIVVEMLSRFRSAREAAQIKEQLAAGKIDVIIGTHALLSSDVEFRDLGLLVIDEEHRFGVRHKERIKKIRQSVDVLSMSATPIPRTLYFAMMGARKISVMETPPKDRFPVETFVREYSDDVVRSAISAEIARGGQVFYLHNRVATIDAAAERLKRMFPDLRIGVGHGRMDEFRLERLMADFVEGKYDVLVCTTIIESGLDIPNCNTIIIEGADKFGLAQLYQLRGRVGRFTRRAYAWLLLHRHAALVESARKRLGAIRQYNKPGAGFRIAARDLQLRGCGNLLGARQSGHVAGVGFDLYCSLLKKSIALLKGERKAYWVRAKVSLPFIVMGEGGKSDNSLSNAETLYQEMKMKESIADNAEVAKAYIPKEYIPQTSLRVDLHRRLSQAESVAEVEDAYAQSVDRFGPVPEPAKILFLLARIRILAESNRIVSVETEASALKLGENSGGGIRYLRINGRFPRLRSKSATGRLEEIENFLRHTLPSLRQT